MNIFVADTMAVVLWLEARKMPQAAKDVFIKCEGQEVQIFIPAMVLTEISYLSERGRIDTTLNDVAAHMGKHKNFRLHPLDIDVIRNAFEIVDIPELHDRLIAGSGKLFSCPVITNDPFITGSQFVTTIWK